MMNEECVAGDAPRHLEEQSGREHAENSGLLSEDAHSFDVERGHRLGVTCLAKMLGSTTMYDILCWNQVSLRHMTCISSKR